jgi:LemA protein
VLEPLRRQRLFVERREPGLERLRQQRRRVRQHDDEAAHASGVQRAPERRQRPRVGAHEHVLAAVAAALAVEDDDRGVGLRTGQIVGTHADEAARRGVQRLLDECSDLREGPAAKQVLDHRIAQRTAGADDDHAPRRGRRPRPCPLQCLLEPHAAVHAATVAAARRRLATPAVRCRPRRRRTTMTIWTRRVALAAAAALSLLLAGCGYNEFQRLDEEVKASWSEVLNQYQRRADLIPNIVATVKGEADFEQTTLTQVIEARAKATSIQVTPETLNNPEAFNRFQQAQGELGSALSRLMAVAENYPNLKANQAFQDLRVQLEGTENRITVARNQYIRAVQQYNVLRRSFPTNLTAMIFGYDVKPSFTVANEAQISTPPTVDFSRPAAPAASR